MGAADGLGRIPVWLIMTLFSAGLVLVTGSYFFLAHVRDRIDRFLASENEIGSQIQKSMDAFANGNLLGRGPGEGYVKMTLPDVHTDFIFALAGEECGVWLTTIIVAAFAAIVVRSMTLSMRDNNLFVMYAASGLAASLGGQAIVNMCSALQLMPAKGMTLPFVSYGGSSMLASCLAMGMLLAITRKNAAAEDKDNG